jgi:hypothetical protein
MSYDKPWKSEVYYMPSSTYGSAAVQKKIKSPKNKQGLVKDINVLVSADCVGTTTVPELNVGVSAGSSEYARFRLGTTATVGYTAANTPFRARALVEGQAGFNGAQLTLADFAGHISLETAKIPADTGVFISAVAGVGTPAGTYEAYVHIDWD